MDKLYVLSLVLYLNGSAGIDRLLLWKVQSIPLANGTGRYRWNSAGITQYSICENVGQVRETASPEEAVIGCHTLMSHFKQCSHNSTSGCACVWVGWGEAEAGGGVKECINTSALVIKSCCLSVENECPQGL